VSAVLRTNTEFERYSSSLVDARCAFVEKEKVPIPNMYSFKSLLTALTAYSIAGAALAQTASDNFENNNPGAAYNDGISYGDNGGIGFGALTYLEGTGGGLFDAGLSGARALGVFAGGGGGNTQALGRSLNSSLTTGSFTLQARFDLNNFVAFSGFNLKSGLGAGFGANELLSFGLTPGSGNAALFLGGAANQTLTLSGVTELRGVNLDILIDFDTAAATYTFNAKRTIDVSYSSISGSLKDTNGGAAGTGSVAAVGIGNFNTGSGQNLVADNITAVPEPTSVALLSLIAGASLLGRWRRVA